MHTQSAKPNLTLIGMAGAGKSTLGKALAQKLNYAFLDTDLLLEEQAGCSLQAILEQAGPDGLRQQEAQVVQSLHLQHTVIATGGSVIYSAAAMAHLRNISHIVYLEAPFAMIAARIGNASQRGFVRAPGQTLRDVYEERLPLYRQYADVIIPVQDQPVAQTVERVWQRIQAADITCS